MVRREGLGGRQVEANSARGPCAHCGALVVAVAPPQVQQNADSKPKGQSQGQEAAYIKSLQQQIKILELEVAYLKRQPPTEKGKEEGRGELVGEQAEGRKEAAAAAASGQGGAELHDDGALPPLGVGVTVAGHQADHDGGRDNAAQDGHDGAPEAGLPCRHPELVIVDWEKNFSLVNTFDNMATGERRGIPDLPLF